MLSSSKSQNYILGTSLAEDSTLPVQGAWVQTLIRELRSVCSLAWPKQPKLYSTNDPKSNFQRAIKMESNHPQTSALFKVVSSSFRILSNAAPLIL